MTLEKLDEWFKAHAHISVRLLYIPRLYIARATSSAPGFEVEVAESGLTMEEALTKMIEATERQLHLAPLTD